MNSPPKCCIEGCNDEATWAVEIWGSPAHPYYLCINHTTHDLINQWPDEEEAAE